jgi:hypothetical protein
MRRPRWPLSKVPYGSIAHGGVEKRCAGEIRAVGVGVAQAGAGESEPEKLTLVKTALVSMAWRNSQSIQVDLANILIMARAGWPHKYGSLWLQT